MENSKKSAFPEIKTDKQYYTENGTSNIYGNTYSFGGLTKREYTAIKAMQGLCAKEGWSDRICNEGEENPLFRQIANASIKIADELLKQLES